MSTLQLLAINDLCKRWCYTKAGIHKLTTQPDFPLPIATVCQGSMKIFALDAIQSYESNRPWLFDPALKRARVLGYYKSLRT